jgi:hypothetical protein
MAGDAGGRAGQAADASGTAGGAGRDGAGGAASAAAVRRGLLVQYDFREAAGEEVLDTSGRAPPMPLKIYRLVDRVPHGLRFRPPPGMVDPKWNTAAYDSPMVSSGGYAKKLIDGIKASKELSVEVWMKPADAKQGGPARILALAQSNYDGANLQLAHGAAGCSDGNLGQFFHIRVLSAGIGGNGCPSMKAPEQSNVSGHLQHVVLTQDAKGMAVLYLDGKPSVMEQRGAFTPHTAWSDKAALALGNLPLATASMQGASESNGRFWVGELYYVAIYDVALASEEVKTNAAIPYQMR